jgi:hypothetical protein
MKRINPILITTILFAVMVGCGGNKQPADELITVDVTTTNYPKKELILQDFMDVEYIPLETNDEFINQGFVQAIGKEIILVINRNQDGDIFVYDKTGKALRKINRKGQSGEEYVSLYSITLDESNDEMFVNDILGQKIVVYDLYGNFKRSLTNKKGIEFIFYEEIFNYNKDNLICYDKYNEAIPFVLVSKQDGSITKGIKIPFKKKISLEKILDNVMVGPGPYCSIIPFKGNWILSELSCDTVYTFLLDYSLSPFIVRTPSVQSMDPEVVLLLRFFSDRYYFMEAIENVFNINSRSGFSKFFFMYDKQEKNFWKYTVYNGDYTTKKEIYLNWLRPVDHEIESWQSLEAHQLVESYKKGELKGKLKEIAATLNEESNPVIMLVKHRK